MDFHSRLLWAVGIAWLFTLPALLTHGRCNAELDQELQRLKHDMTSFESPKLADAYWSRRAVDHTVLSPDECRQRQPRNLEHCGDGPLVVATIPIENWICRTYRDEDIRVWHQYDARHRLVRYETDMEPCKQIPIPFTKLAISFAD